MTKESEPHVKEFAPSREDGSDVPETNSDDSDSIVNRQTKVRRLFSFVQLFFFALTYMSSWEAVISNLVPVFYNGGPRSLSWGILVVIAGALAQTASLAEMAALQPIAGAQYHWTAALAPPRHRRIITWFQGWMTLFGWISILIGVANVTAYIIQAMAVANYPEYVPYAWHVTLIIFALLIIQSLMNAFTFWMVPWIELLSGVLHVVLFVVFIAVLLATTKDKHTAEFVFIEPSTISGWTDSYVSWNLGLMAPTWGFVGFDAAVHMSEEVRKAKHAVPRAMFWSIAVNGVMAYVMTIVVLFCIGDIDELLASQFPVLTILLNSTGSLKAATVLCCGLLVTSLSTCLGTIASVSRLTWAWARDGALPKYFSYISPTYRVPVRAIWLPVFVTMLLALLNIGSTAAYGAFIALSSMGLYSSYIIAISCMLYARLSKEGVEASGWNLGRLGVPVNIFALLYSAYIFVFLPFPTTLPVTGPSMNYALPIWTFAVLFAVSSWWIWARRKWPGLNEKVLQAVLADSDRNTKD